MGIARSTKAFFIALIGAALLLVMTRAALIPNYQVISAAAAIVVLFLWSLAGWGLRVLFLRLGGPSLSSGFAFLLSRREGLFRLFSVLICVWLGFVAKAFVKWEPFYDREREKCASERFANRELGNPFECYHLLDPQGFDEVFRAMWPMEYFAYRQAEIAILPAIFVAVMVGAWVVKGFRSRVAG